MFTLRQQVWDAKLGEYLPEDVRYIEAPEAHELIDSYAETEREDIALQMMLFWWKDDLTSNAESATVEPTNERNE